MKRKYNYSFYDQHVREALNMQLLKYTTLNVEADAWRQLFILPSLRVDMYIWRVIRQSRHD
jgi:hypothetical protein